MLPIFRWLILSSVLMNIHVFNVEGFSRSRERVCLGFGHSFSRAQCPSVTQDTKAFGVTPKSLNKIMEIDRLSSHKNYRRNSLSAVFINKKSGGKVGSRLFQNIQKLKSKNEVCDLTKEMPGVKLGHMVDQLSLWNTEKNADSSSRKVTTATKGRRSTLLIRSRNSNPQLTNRVYGTALCCGGDGTIRWIMDETEALLATRTPNHTITATKMNGGAVLKTTAPPSVRSRDDHNVTAAAAAVTLSDVRFGLIPTGTGNDLYNHLMSPSVSTYKNPSATSLKNINKQMRHKLNSKALWHKDTTAEALHLFSNNNTVVIPFDRWQVEVSHKTAMNRAKERLFMAKRMGTEHLQNMQNKLPFPGQRQRLADKLHDSKTVGRMKTAYTKAKTNAKATYKRVSDAATSMMPVALVTQNEVKSFNNYLGIGVDGRVTGAFAEMRTKYPSLFFHKLVNRMWYGVVWFVCYCKGGNVDLSRSVEIFIDDKRVVLDKALQGNLRGIVAANINSFAGGATLWPPVRSFGAPPVGRSKAASTTSAQLRAKNSVPSVDAIASSKAEWKPQRSDDGIIELVGLTGMPHLAQVTTGITGATYGIPIGQGRNIRIVSNATLPISMQVDGEPWMQPGPYSINVTHRSVVNVLLPRPPSVRRPDTVSYCIEVGQVD